MQLQARCTICGQGFAYSDHLIVHMQREHPTRDATEPLFHIATTLNRIADLLQQLVDGGQQVTPSSWMHFPYRCTACRMGWDTYEEAAPHWESGAHQRIVAMATPTR